MRTMGGRPVLMQRFPQGASGKSFFQKRVPDGAPDWLETTTVADRQRHAVAGAGRRRCRARGLGRQPRLPRLPRLAEPRRRPDHADELRIDLDPQPGTGFKEAGAAAHELKALLDELGIAGYPKTTGNRGLHVYVRLEPKLGLLPGALRRRGRRARAGAPPTRPAHRRVVEGGARRAGVHRLQPERAAQDRVRRVVGARPQGRPGLDAARVGRARRRRSRRAHDGEGAGATGARRRSVGRDGARSRWSRCWRCTSATRADGLLDAPWPPVYPKQPNEPPRVAPSRARAQD